MDDSYHLGDVGDGDGDDVLAGCRHPHGVWLHYLMATLSFVKASLDWKVSASKMGKTTMGFIVLLLMTWSMLAISY